MPENQDGSSPFPIYDGLFSALGARCFPRRCHFGNLGPFPSADQGTRASPLLRWKPAAYCEQSSGGGFPANRSLVHSSTAWVLA